METMLKERLYEVEFETLEKKQIEAFENKSAILNAKLDMSVVIGKCEKSIKDIIDLKVGDIIYLDKTVDEDLDIEINNKNVAKGETIKLDEKISVRISEFKWDSNKNK